MTPEANSTEPIESTTGKEVGLLNEIGFQVLFINALLVCRWHFKVICFCWCNCANSLHWMATDMFVTMYPYNHKIICKTIAIRPLQ